VISRSGDRQAGGAERGSRASFVVRYCIGHANHQFRPSRDHGDPHLRRARRAAERRGVDRAPSRPRQPARARFPRRHPHPAIRRRREDGGNRPDVAGHRHGGDAGDRPARRRPRVRSGRRAAGHRDGDRQGQGIGPRRGRTVPDHARGPARRLCGDGGAPRAGGHAVGQCRARAQRRTVAVPRGASGPTRTPSAFPARTGRPWSSTSPPVWWRRGRCA